MVSAEYHPLEVPPKALNGVGGNAAFGVFLDSVVDYIVDVALACEPLIGGHLVREHHRVLGNELLDDRHESLGLGVLHLHGAYGSAAFHHTEDWRFRLGASALRFLRPLALMLVNLATAEIHLVYLNFTGESRRIVLLIEGAHLMENEPRGLLRDVDVAVQLMGRNALLVATDKVHSHEPLDEWNLRVLEDGSDKHGEIALAVVAAVTAVGAFYAVVASAVRANDVALAPTGVADCTDAALLGVEVLGDCENGVEVREVNHSKGSFMSAGIILYSKHKGTFHLVKTFFV